MSAIQQILGKKVKQQNTEFGTIEDDGLGRTMIHLSMKGPMADPKFEWDRKSVEKKISEEGNLGPSLICAAICIGIAILFASVIR